ncbi:hypothetical protein FB566_0846 [Stackebrandtia endophytica]|uniref:Uncharacterized protein n=1 Tax=Stackebrandtia endophytica TaxID=1496996 RepID=A0A543ARZ3_9ACTN|nr:hypothetical protein [Stackebrandtia endophytica]TQL75348.1 hypothetical protein FB566_0846 [Stackebrandtia endophytica]
MTMTQETKQTAIAPVARGDIESALDAIRGVTRVARRDDLNTNPRWAAVQSHLDAAEARLWELLEDIAEASHTRVSELTRLRIIRATGKQLIARFTIPGDVETALTSAFDAVTRLKHDQAEGYLARLAWLDLARAVYAYREPLGTLLIHTGCRVDRALGERIADHAAALTPIITGLIDTGDQMSGAMAVALVDNAQTILASIVDGSKVDEATVVLRPSGEPPDPTVPWTALGEHIEQIDAEVEALTDPASHGVAMALRAAADRLVSARTRLPVDTDTATGVEVDHA